MTRLSAENWRETYTGLAQRWAVLLERFDLAEDATPDDILAAARAAAGHRTPNDHDCFLMNCARLGEEVRLLQTQFIDIEAESAAAARAEVIAEIRAGVEGLAAPSSFATDAAFVSRAAVLALLSAPPLRPSGEPEPGGLDVERREPTVEPSHFGDWIDFGPLAADTIIVAVNDGGGYQPVLWVKLPHQLYVADVEKLYAEHREVWVLPIRSSGWIAVPRILATTPERPAGEAGTDA